MGGKRPAVFMTSMDSGANRIRRSILSSIGPNHQHHADGHEKLNAQALNMGGVCLNIYGIKDQWSSFILYLVFIPNNRLATTIGHVYLDCVENLKYMCKYSSLIYDPMLMYFEFLNSNPHNLCHWWRQRNRYYLLFTPVKQACGKHYLPVLIAWICRLKSILRAAYTPELDENKFRGRPRCKYAVLIIRRSKGCDIGSSKHSESTSRTRSVKVSRLEFIISITLFIRMSSPIHQLVLHAQSWFIYLKTIILLAMAKDTTKSAQQIRRILE
jgi:hypothetical protein